jgi:hypothetical protein
VPPKTIKMKTLRKVGHGGFALPVIPANRRLRQEDNEISLS